MRIIRFPAAALSLAPLLLLLAACSDNGGDDRSEELRANRALWNSQALSDYQFVQERSCFCGPDVVDPTRVDVRGGEAVRAQVMSDGRLLPGRYFLTVVDAFDLVEQAITNNYERLEVHYDPARGYPVSISMDPGRGVLDGGFGLVCSDLEPLTPESTCPPPPSIGPCDCDAVAPATSWHYTAWDDSGMVAAEGCMRLTFTAREGTNPSEYDVAGHRCITVRCQADAGSAHQGSNDVGGRLDATGQLSLNLNADWADFNIFLNGAMSDVNTTVISGTWGESWFTGPVAGGTFLMERSFGSRKADRGHWAPTSSASFRSPASH